MKNNIRKNFHSPTTVNIFVATAVKKNGASVVTSQVKLPDKLNPTLRKVTWVSFETVI